MGPAKTKIFRVFPLKRQEGFTLNEVLIAIVLIAIGVLGFSLNTIGVIQGNYISANYTTATNLAQDKMEELKAQTSFSDGVDNYDSEGSSNCTGLYTGADPQPDLNITTTGTAGGIYDRCWRITDSALGSGLKQIDVTVSWRDYIDRTVILSTLVFTE